MVKPARSSQSSLSFPYLPYFLPHMLFQKGPHTDCTMSGLSPISYCIQPQNPRLYLLLCQDHNSIQEDTARRDAPQCVSLGLGKDPNHQFWFLCLPFLPVIFLSLHSFGRVVSGSQTPHSTILCLAGSCGFSCCSRWWLRRFLLPALVVYQPLHQEEILKLDSWCSCCSYQPVMGTGWHQSEKSEKFTERSTQLCNRHKPFLEKTRVSVFWGPQRIFLHLPTGGAVGQMLDWTVLKPYQLCSEDLCTIR